MHIHAEIPSLSARRAWIEINPVDCTNAGSLPSLSARRAWIEIETERTLAGRSSVALRKESVDRNKFTSVDNAGDDTSLSARRAWIEISRNVCYQRTDVSLSARRAWIEIINFVLETAALFSRSPQGERG